MSYDVLTVSFMIEDTTGNPGIVPVRYCMGSNGISRPGSSEPGLEDFFSGGRIDLTRGHTDGINVAVEVAPGEFVSVAFSVYGSTVGDVIATHADFEHNGRVVRNMLKRIPGYLRSHHVIWVAKLYGLAVKDVHQLW